MAYTIDLLLPVRNAMLATIDTGVARPAFKIYDSGNVLLATLALADPAGSVNGTTGLITLTPGTPETNAPAGGEASYATLSDGDGVILENNVPVEQGTAPVAGKVIISTLNIIAGGTVELISATIG
jgi:hypothetical protein